MSSTMLPMGPNPSVPLKVAISVIVPLPAATLKTVPSLNAPPEMWC